MYIVHLYIKEKEMKKENDNIKTMYEKIMTILSLIFWIVLPIGFFMYYNKKKIEIGGSFNLFKFLVGNSVCDDN
tara:strand:- start:1650 stop:1871 length:222 start_codon:yes stop_codon:yes gene_type:complete